MIILEISILILLILNLFGTIYLFRNSMRSSNETFVKRSFIERYNSPEFMESKVQLDLFLKQMDGLSQIEKRDKIIRLHESTTLDDIRTKFHITNVINLFTELGVAYRAGMIGNDELFTFNAIIPNYWEKLQDYISIERSLSKRPVYTSFEYLKDQLHEKPFWKDGALVRKIAS